MSTAVTSLGSVTMISVAAPIYSQRHCEWTIDVEQLVNGGASAMAGEIAVDAARPRVKFHARDTPASSCDCSHARC
jgi:hypothetical protein